MGQLQAASEAARQAIQGLELGSRGVNEDEHQLLALHVVACGSQQESMQHTWSNTYRPVLVAEITMFPAQLNVLSTKLAPACLFNDNDQLLQMEQVVNLLRLGLLGIAA